MVKLFVRAFISAVALVFVGGAMTAPASAAVPVDLLVTNAGRAPQSRQVGTNLGMAVEVRSRSARTAPIPRTLKISLFLSTDAARGGDILLRTMTVPSSVLRQAGPVMMIGRIPTTVKPRAYRVLACVTGAVLDPLPANNCRLAAGALRVTAAPPPKPTPPPAGVVLVPVSSSVALTSHHFAAGVVDNPGLAKEVVVRNIGAQTTGPLQVDYPAGVSDDCGLRPGTRCADLDPEPCQGATLATGERCSMLLTFEPDRIATLNAQLVVRDRTLLIGSQTPARIQLTGQTVGGAFFSVGNLIAGVPSGVPDYVVARTIGVTNIGDASGVPGLPDVTFSSAYFNVAIENNTCGIVLAVDETCTFDVRVTGGTPSGVNGTVLGSIDVSGPSTPGVFRLNVTNPG